MNENEVDKVLGNLVRAVKILEECLEFADLIPEVRTNIVYALPNAQTIDEVAAIEGRITKINDRPKACGYPAFGASSHMARLIIEIMKTDKNLRAGINLSWSEEFSKWLEEWSNKNNIVYGYIDRFQEPEEISKIEGRSIPWKVEYLLRKYNTIPRIFYESPGIGKEPLFVLIGENAVEVANLSVRIAKEWKRAREEHS